jgi:hypothetical protein
VRADWPPLILGLFLFAARKEVSSQAEMASIWRIECPPSRWIGYADAREDADRMAAEHVSHAVGEGPRRDHRTRIIRQAGAGVARTLSRSAACFPNDTVSRHEHFAWLASSLTARIHDIADSGTSVARRQPWPAGRREIDAIIPAPRSPGQW